MDIPEELKSFRDKRGELAAEQGCLLWGIRVVIPASLQRKVLNEIHGGHLGVVKMKALARGHVWWPRIDQDIEFSTKNCDGCRLVKHDPKLTPVHPWEFPEGPWRRVHIDFAGPFEGKQFLVAVDAYSKWPEVVIVEDTSTEKTLDELRAMFARWGNPQQIVSDSSRLTNLNSLSERTTVSTASQVHTTLPQMG